MTEKDHHPAMFVKLRHQEGLSRPIFYWGGFDGYDVGTARNPFVNSAGYTVKAADTVEPHTFLIDVR